MLDAVITALCGTITPGILCFGGIVLAARLPMGRLLMPGRFYRILTDVPEQPGVSPFAGLTMALAGTLGVGNITGVAAAIGMGGPGAVFWMWVGALLSMSVKYGEVALAVKYRRGRGGAHYGGAMYYISEGLGRRFGGRSLGKFGGFFAILCVINSLVTGNIIQSNAGADTFQILPESATGVFLAALVALSIVYGVQRCGRITTKLIPVLAGGYMLLSAVVILTNLPLLPRVFRRIVASAFTVEGAAGGAVGFTMGQGIRYGITRGIFSNEAGCGTSPTAHAAADTKSPFHQGCYGIFEVAADTLLLCTMTAVVLLLGEERGLITATGTANGGAGLTIAAFEGLLACLFGAGVGTAVRWILSLSVLLFAYATILAQLYYGTVALGYLTESRRARFVYLLLSVGGTFLGCIMDSGVMWTLADLVVCGMTVINMPVLLLLRREIGETAKDWKKAGLKPGTSGKCPGKSKKAVQS